MRKNIICIMVTLLAIAAMVLVGCAAPAPANPSTTSAASSNQPTAPSSAPATSPAAGQTVTTGKLEIAVTDAPTKEDISSIMVKIKGIEVHKAVAGEATPAPSNTPVEGAQPTNEPQDNLSWTKVDVGANNEFDLLKVKDHPETLNVVPAEIGTYTQIRLEVDSVKVTFGSGDKAVTETATVPSGKIRFIQTFNISATEITQLLFDFDAAQSVNVAGNGKVMFKPVIKLTSGKSNKPADKIDQLKISSDKLADGKVGAEYNATLAATGGTAPYKWSITTGQLPAGLTLNQGTGVISGTPTASGEFPITVKVDDSAAEPKSATKNFTLKIAVADLQITTASLPNGIAGTAYAANTKLEATGGKTPYTWSITEGALPANLVLDAATGVISGTPAAAGDTNITVKVTDSSTPQAKSVTKALTIHIAAAP